MASLEELVSKDLNENNIFTDLREQSERLRILEEYGGAYHQVTQAEINIDFLSSIDIIAGNGLVGGGTLTGDVTLTLGTPSTLSVSSSDAVTSTSHTHAITTSANPGAAAFILASDASGYLQLKRLGLDVSPTSPLHIRSGTTPQLRLEYNADNTAYLQTSGSGVLRLYSSGNLELYPDGDLLIGAGGKDVLPVNAYDINIGAINKKYLTLHAAELWVQTLVAQDVMATVGGRILVGPTTYLHQDLGSGDYYMICKHNNLAAGDIVMLESNGQVEFLGVGSDPQSSSGGYNYRITRNLDGTGVNQWNAGDAVFNTGTGGDGFIDLYSVAGVEAGLTAGPTIVGNVRPAAGTNLVQNPGFEIAGLGGSDVFQNWVETANLGLIEQHSNAHSGSWGCRITSSPGTPAIVEQTISMVQNTDYLLTFWTDDAGNDRAEYRIYDNGNSADIIPWTPVTDISDGFWVLRFVPFTAPGGCDSITIYFRAPSSETAFFDDVFLSANAHNNWREHWAIGNLNGLYGVSSDVYGVGLGRPDKAYVLIDDTDGVTIRDSIGTKLIQLDVSGNVVFGNVATDHANVFWNNTSDTLEFRGGASGTTVQAFIDTDGSFVAGSPTDKDVKLNSDGLTLLAQPDPYVTGGKSIDFYSTTDSVIMAMITAYRTSAGGDDYVYMVLQATDDLTNGVNYSGHSNPRLAIGWDQFGGNQGMVSVGDAAFVVGSRSFSDIFPAVAGRIYTEGIIDAGGDVLSDGNIIADLDLKTYSGLAVGQPADNPGTGEVRATGHIKTDAGIYVGGRTGATGTGEVRATSHIRTDGGMYIGSKTGSTSSGNLGMSGKILSSTAVGCKVYRTTNLSVASGSQTAITWNAEQWDSDGMFSPSSQYIYFKRTGIYFCFFNAIFTTDWVTSSFNWKAEIISSNDQNLLHWDRFAGSGYASVTVSGFIVCTAVNQWIRADVWHDRGSSWTITNTSRFGAIRIP